MQPEQRHGRIQRDIIAAGIDNGKERGYRPWRFFHEHRDRLAFKPALYKRAASGAGEAQKLRKAQALLPVGKRSLAAKARRTAFQKFKYVFHYQFIEYGIVSTAGYSVVSKRQYC